MSDHEQDASCGDRHLAFVVRDVMCSGDMSVLLLNHGIVIYHRIPISLVFHHELGKINIVAQNVFILPNQGFMRDSPVRVSRVAAGGDGYDFHMESKVGGMRVQTYVMTHEGLDPQTLSVQAINNAHLQVVCALSTDSIHAYRESGGVVELQ